MEMKPLKFLIFMETVVCVYRNYSRFKRFTRALVIFRISLEIILVIANISFRFYYNIFNRISEMLHIYLATGNSIILMPLVCFNSAKFERLVENMEAHYKYFEADTKQLDSLDNKQKCYMGLVILFEMAIVCMYVYWGIQRYISINEINLTMFYVFQITIYLCELRYFLEIIVVNCLLSILSQQLTSVIKSIDEETTGLVLVDSKTRFNQPTATERGIKLFDKWYNAYINIKESSRLFNCVFSLQLSVMFAATILYYILLFYSMTIFSVSAVFPPIQFFLQVITLLAYLFVIYMLSFLAQRAENNSILLRRKLCKLLLHCLPVPEYRERTQNLLRVVTTRPIRTQSYGAINVDMSLLPSCIALCTSYTIVALQFNKVI